MTRPSDEYYSDLDSRLRKLLGEVSDGLESRQVSQVQEFIDHSEYGLALSWLADSVLDSTLATSEIIRSQIQGLANVMGIEEELPEQFRAATSDG
jgi:hypothetical protein